MLDIPDPKARVIGTKQVLRAIEKGNLERVIIAMDADPFIRNQVIAACLQNGIPYQTTESMLELGKACGIEVGAATCGELKPD